MIGGRTGGRVSRAASPALGAGRPALSRQPKGGEAAVGTGSGRRAEEPCSTWLCRAMAPHGGCRGGERGARRASRERHLVFDAIECKCENTKVSCMDCNLTWRVKRKRPPDFSDGRPCFQEVVRAQLAATARPARASAAATRSTSASAAVRASATHFSSRVLRPKV